MATGTQPTAQELDVHVVTPDSEVWSGRASFVVVRALDGELGVLPGHEAFLAILRDGPLRIESRRGNFNATVDGGFLSVSTVDGVTRVDVLAEHVAEVA